MARTNVNNPDAILCADIHLREDTPLCRIDNYWETQWKKIKFIQSLSYEHDEIPILVAGDLFDKPKPSIYLIIEAMKTIENYITVCGQHDLPNHNLNLFNKSGMALLQEAGNIETLIHDDIRISNSDFSVTGFPWGTELCSTSKGGRRKIALCHTLVYENNPFPDAPLSGNVNNVMKKLEGYDLVVTGDNHQKFICKNKNQLLVNPGSLMRMSANQINHKPAVYLWYSKNNEIKEISIPIENGVIDNTHLESAKKKDKRMEVFVKRLKDDFEVGLSFSNNLKSYFKKNRVKNQVQQLIWNSLDN